MTPPIIDITGHRFGRLTVTRNVGCDSQRNRLWQCICDCGNTSAVSSINLRNGRTRSCGCLHAEQSALNGAASSYKDIVGYHGAHIRVYKEYGKASGYECEHCTNVAEDWALMKRASRVWEDEYGYYSCNPDDYMPLCKLCHQEYDHVH